MNGDRALKLLMSTPHLAVLARRRVGPHGHRAGVVLIVVTVAIVMLSLAGLGFVLTLGTEHKAINLHGDELRLQQLVESGVELMSTFVEQSPETQQSAGGADDNSDVFRAALVVSDERAARHGRVTLVSPRWDEDEIAGVRYGLEDESGRLNLAVLPEWERPSPGSAQRALMLLPGMTESAAAKILDWIDADDSPRPSGAEREQYADLRVPYAPRNGCPARLEELLLIRDVPRNALLGRDFNFDFQLSPHETGGQAERMGGQSGGAPLPWTSLLTVHSAERNVNPRGGRRIDLNDSDLRRLYMRLAAAVDPKWAEFIVLYRQFGSAAGNVATAASRPPGGQPRAPGPANSQPPVGGLPPMLARAGGVAAASPTGQSPAGPSAPGPPPPATIAGVAFDLNRPGVFRIESVLDLIGARIMLSPPLTPQPRVVESPFSADRAAMRTYLPVLLDETTVAAGSVIRGRVNMNTASRVVLRGVPGMDDRLVEAIISDRRATADDAGRRHPTWLLTEGLADLQQMKALLPRLNCGGHVYRSQVIGYFEEGGPMARAEVVVDATVIPPRPVMWTDLRVRGRGLSREDL